MSFVTIKQVHERVKIGQHLETTYYEISGNAPFVEKFVLVKEKPKEGFM